MSNVIKIKKSGTIGATPSSLELGELSLNYADGKLFYKDSSGVIQSFSGGGGGGSPGIEISPTPPVDTSVLWVDTSDTATLAIPSGGTTGQILAKNSDTDYDVSWSAKPGLVLIKSQAIGSSVTFVEVTNAFSSTYDAYKVIITGGSSTTNNYIKLTLGATATGYYAGYSGVTFGTGAAALGVDNNGTAWTAAGYAATTTLQMNVDIINPFLTEITYVNGFLVDATTGRSYAGLLNNSTSYTAFTLTATSGAWTGGTVRVYGYSV